LRLAICVSWLNQYGGAEKVLETAHELFPDAPIYTTIYWPQAMPAAYRDWDIRVSMLNRLPFIRRHHQLFLSLYPLGVESFDLSDYDVVLSITSAFAHGIITPPETLHICYCLTPARFLWNYQSYAQREGLGRLADVALRPVLNYLRLWDRLAADRVDHFIAISREVQRRIRKYYHRQSAIIYPPVDTGRLHPADGYGDYFLVVSRLIPYKRIDLAVRAFNELDLPLKIVGEGRDRAALQALARPNVEFLGWVGDEELQQLLSRARAFVFPGLEDFGIAPVEAMAAGRPVIAYAGGGALDTVKPGVTGEFFAELTPESLAGAVRDFDPTRYDPATIRSHAEQFDQAVFQRELKRFVNEQFAAHRAALRREPGDKTP
jgi:glycosyltransferase involved in cell wall biosynthesis